MAILFIMEGSFLLKLPLPMVLPSVLSYRGGLLEQYEAFVQRDNREMSFWRAAPDSADTGKLKRAYHACIARSVGKLRLSIGFCKGIPYRDG